MENNNNRTQAHELPLDSFTTATAKKPAHKHSAGDGLDEVHEEEGDEHGDQDKKGAGWKTHWDLLLALLILVVMLVLKFAFDYTPGKWIDFAIHFVAFILAGWSVLDLAYRKVKRADIFNEFVLMSVATMGAFYIGSY